MEQLTSDWEYYLKERITEHGFPTTDMIIYCPLCGQKYVLEDFEDFSDGMGEDHNCPCGTYLEIRCKQPTERDKKVEVDEYDGMITKTITIVKTTPKEPKYYLTAGKL